MERRQHFSPILIFLLLFSLGLAAQETTVDELAWMSGSWFGEQGGTQMEEHWILPAGGLMLGMHRDVFPDNRSFFEFLRIVQKDGAVFLLASPMGRTPVTFKLVRSEKTMVVFANKEHDFPQEISYRLNEEGALVAGISGLSNGEKKSKSWTWRKRN